MPMYAKAPNAVGMFVAVVVVVVWQNVMCYLLYRFLCVNQRSVKCFWSGDENIPASIHIDARDLDIGDAVHSTNLRIPDGLTFENPNHLYSFVSVLGSKGLTEEEAVAAGAAATSAAKATPAKT